VVFAGFASDFSLAYLLALLRMKLHVVGLITSTRANRSVGSADAMSRIAHHLRVPFLRISDINEERSQDDIARLAPSAGIMASFDQILTAETLAIPTHGWLNIHPSLLPAYRGPEPVYWSISDGATNSGVTMHRAVPRIDAGPILAQVEVPATTTDTSGTLTRRTTAAGVQLLEHAVRGLVADEPGVRLDLGAGSYRPSIGHCFLDSLPSAAAAGRRVRAGNPDKLCWTMLDGRPVYVRQARCVPAAGERMGIAFGDGHLQLLEIQPTCGCSPNRGDCSQREYDRQQTNARM
jgi:methionyl-tRNA formyltransferase